jgi:hypothetical protein
MKDEDLGTQLLDALEKALCDVPFLEIVRTQEPNSTLRNRILAVRVAKNREMTLIVETRQIGQPRVIREAINQLFRYTLGKSKIYGIVAAPYISPAAAKICRQEGVGYLDLAGNCCLVFDTVYIVREGAKNPFARKRDLRSLFSARGARVLRVMLSNPKVAWKTHPLASKASVSTGQVANIKNLLKNREWIIEGNKGFQLKEPAQLLSEWSEQYSFRKSEVREFYSLLDIPTIEAKLADVCAGRGVKFAFTGLGGAARMLPGIRYQRTMAFIAELPTNLPEQAGLKEVNSGANVTLLIPYDEGVFNDVRSIDGLPVVCPIQLYLDLKSYKGRGSEAAQTIYDNLLSTSW